MLCICMYYFLLPDAIFALVEVHCSFFLFVCCVCVNISCSSSFESVVSFYIVCIICIVTFSGSGLVWIEGCHHPGCDIIAPAYRNFFLGWFLRCTPPAIRLLEGFLCTFWCIFISLFSGCCWPKRGGGGIAVVVGVVVVLLLLLLLAFYVVDDKDEPDFLVLNGGGETSFLWTVS